MNGQKWACDQGRGHMSKGSGQLLSEGQKWAPDQGLGPREGQKWAGVQWESPHDN